MKTLSITLAIVSLIVIAGLSSCQKKYNRPQGHQEKKECSDQNDDASSTPTATASLSGT